MKLIQTEVLIERGAFAVSEERRDVMAELASAVGEVRWPLGNDQFLLNNSGKHCNGVKPIKSEFVRHLTDRGWMAEERLRVSAGIGPGKVDVARRSFQDGRWMLVEWETGNISSSHRALNKMALAMIEGAAVFGALVVPSRSMYRWLTDRVGNIDELRPYFKVWTGISSIVDGVLCVLVVEHDALDPVVPAIGKGTDGRALR